MSNKRRQYKGEYKFKVALEAVKGDKTISQLSSETGIHPSQIRNWKQQLLAGGPELFNGKGASNQPGQATQEVEHAATWLRSPCGVRTWKALASKSV